QAFLFQPFHFIEFSAAYNPEKKVNRANNVEMKFPIIDILSDIRKTGYALLLTEILNKVFHKEEKNEKLFVELEKMIISFEHRSFNAVFGLFFIKEILTHFGIQPLNNFGAETPYFSLSDGKFTNNFDPNIEENFPHQQLNKLLGTNIDNIFLFKINSTNRRLIMDLFLRYMSYHEIVNTDKLNSIKILQSLYD
ncbi:DNA repair protein RecO C-terminal domain-containing protein, partial [Bacteroidota bacterium]|nr:DNA repair protein RecO C-terminal domain-containing protein [Bacteroidota bacterium]